MIYLKKIIVIFGGRSSEHDISIISGTSIIEHLDKTKYEIIPVYISRDNVWYYYKKDINSIKTFSLGDKPIELEKIDNIILFLKQADVVFPALHGLYGEDGTIQGLFELFNIKYVGCGVLSSSICMDKAYSKITFEAAGLNQAKYICLVKKNNKYYDINNQLLDIDDINDLINNSIKYPVYIKPSRGGSSIGINKAINVTELKKYIDHAFLYDNKVLIEEEIIGREIECSVIGTNDIFVSSPGEILSDNKFYSFDSKYKSNKSTVDIPAKIDNDVIIKIKNLAKKAYLIANCNGLSRVDFFLKDDKIYINEINTMPGFTTISMFPKLLDYSGIKYSELLDKLINDTINDK